MVKGINNPFKMIGGYIGIVVSYLVLIILIYLISALFNFGIGESIFNIIKSSLNRGLIATFVVLIIGFLIGWIIQLLIRKYKK